MTCIDEINEFHVNHQRHYAKEDTPGPSNSCTFIMRKDKWENLFW